MVFEILIQSLSLQRLQNCMLGVLGIFLLTIISLKNEKNIFIPNFRVNLRPAVIYGFEDGRRFNRSSMREIQRNVSAYMKRWEAVQVFRSDVPWRKITVSRTEKELKACNQTHTVSKQYQCALVGNSGILLDSRCGDVIDRFKLVIRMNLAPFGGEFKRDVGSKVDLDTFNLIQLERLLSCTDTRYPPEAKCNITDQVCLKKREEKYGTPREAIDCDDLLDRLKRANGTTLWYFKKIGNIAAIRRLLGVLKPKYNIDIHFAYSPRSLMGPATKAFEIEFPSSGLAVYSAATQFCHKIYMFGFYPLPRDPNNRTIQHHYYEVIDMNHTENVHKMPSEYQVFLRLNRTGTIGLINDCRGLYSQNN
ncbi:alpha-2,8-sialyltransferase 8B-like [Lytechinus pictus]|uniref:alpha-2,8-sialyltransferase 8B-like n=1 Tax=Lytechinus pictus TaxID=7653 RepID=UPI0030BA0ED1